MVKITTATMKKSSYCCCSKFYFSVNFDFPLSDIQGIMSSPDFDKIETLGAHKINLQKRLEKTEQLIKTIDQTLSHLRGETKMQPTNLYEGFQEKFQKVMGDLSTDYKKMLLLDGIMSQQDIDTMTIAEERLKSWVWSDFTEHFSKGDEIYKALVQALEYNLEPTSPEVQVLVEKHYQWSSRMTGPICKQSYHKSNAYLANNTPQICETFAKYHPKLMDYLFSAMKIFSEDL